MRKLHLLWVSCCALLLTALPTYSQEASIPLSDVLGTSIRARHIGPGLTSGRISDLEVHPTNSRIVYVGSAGGGVWKSTSGGSSFLPIFDDYAQSIGTVRLDPSDPDNTIWVGTGECWVRNSVSVGDGIYLSKDGGKSWTHKGLEKSERISSILINPNNPQEITVGVLGALWGDSEDRGIYRSKDGGDTWERIFYVNEKTGCSDLIADPRNPNVMYASFWEFRRTAWSFNSGGSYSALYKSTDGGQSWNKIHNGFPAGKLGRIAIALAPSSPDIVYAVLETEQDEQKGLYKSEDGGSSWKQTNNDFELVVRPFYFSRLVVDPKDPDRILKGGLMGSLSEDGGNTFSSSQGNYHPDVHDYAFDPNVGDRIYMATDGGLYISNDQGESWNMAGDLNLAQFYHITLDNQEPFNVYGGLQDNGSWKGKSSNPGGISAGDWTGVGYGDGFRVYPHPADPNIVYSEMQGAEQVWRVHVPSGEAQIIKPWPEGAEKLRFNWNPPIATSPHKPDRLYIGSQYLHRSEDRGQSWTRLSDDLTTNDPAKLNQDKSGGLSKDNSGAENHCTIFTVAESPLDPAVIWVGTDDGNVQVTVNDGRKWKNVTKNIKGLPANTWTYHIEASSHDRLTAYAVFDGHTRNDGAAYAYKTTDGGKSWTSIITDEVKGFTRSIQEDYKNPNVLYLGTEFGLYVTVNGGSSWTKFTNNMPAVAVHHIEQDPKSGAVVMGTHGRGAIIIDDVYPLQQFNQEIAQKDFHFFDNPPAFRYEQRMFAGSDGNYKSEYGDQFTGESSSNGMKIYYYMKKRHVFGKMKIEVLDSEGELISELPAGKSKGLNQIEWGYRYPLPKIAKGKTITFGGFTAPMVPPGNYTVRVTKGKSVYETIVELQPDPNSVHTQEEQKLSHKTIMQIYRMNESLAKMVEELDEQESLIDQKLAGEIDGKMRQQLESSKAAIAELRKQLVITEGDNYVGRAKNQLRENISDLYGQMASYSGPPSAAQLERYNYLSNELKEAASKWDSLKSRIKAQDSL